MKKPFEVLTRQAGKTREHVVRRSDAQRLNIMANSLAETYLELVKLIGLDEANRLLDAIKGSKQ